MDQAPPTGDRGGGEAREAHRRLRDPDDVGASRVGGIRERDDSHLAALRRGLEQHAGDPRLTVLDPAEWVLGDDEDGFGHLGALTRSALLGPLSDKFGD